ncbi:MAG: hydrolase [Thermotogae bacterium]|nr:hydrolase [Thermotogota bacterium]
MPSGKVHDGVNTAVGLALGVVVWVETEDVVFTILFLLGFFFATYYLSPDLDLEGTRPVRRWGKLSFIWRPYAAVMPHRGLSHIPILGVLTRLGYLFLLLSLLWFLMMGILEYFGLSPPRLKLVPLRSDWWQPFILGVLLADTLHIAMDNLHTHLKRRRRRR